MKYDVLCTPSLNVETPVRLSSQMIPAEMRGKKLTAEKLYVNGDNSNEYVVEIGGQELRFRVDQWNQRPAGSSVNCAVGFSRLGLSVAIAGAVDSDSEGYTLRENLRHHGIGLLDVNRKSGTPQTLCVIDDQGSTTLFCYKPPYTFQTTEMLYKLADVESDMVVATGVRMAELDFVESVFVQRPTGAKWNVLTPNSEIFENHAIRTTRLPLLLKDTHVLQVNETEAEILLGRSSDAEDSALQLLQMGPKVALLTLGNRGAAVAVFRDNGNHEVIRVDSLPSKVVDTTGAGDAFTVGFLYGLYVNQSHKDALSLGRWIAARNIEHYGGHAGMPTLQELKTAELLAA